MKTNKKLLICALLLITMISIVGAVSASESTNDDLGITDASDDSVSTTNSQDPLTDTSTAEATSSSNNEDKQTDSETQNIDKPITSTKKVEEDKLTVGEKTVENTTISNFFNEDGTLNDNVEEDDELIFTGEFKNQNFTINKRVSLTGKNALMNNTAFIIAANNVKISNFTFIADKIFDNNSVIYSDSENTTIENNNITYNAPNTGDSYAIYLTCADGTQLIGNKITYVGKLNNTENIKTMGIYSFDSDNLTIKNNKFDITIPSLDVVYDYVTWEIIAILTEGILLENSDNATFEDNNITVNYNKAAGYADTIHAVKITGADNAQVNRNNITLNGHHYTYGLTLDGKEMTITNNNINSNSDDYYAAGLEIDKNSTAIIKDNNINTKAPGVTYGIYTDDWGMGSTLVIEDNNITAESNTAYGMIVNSKDNAIINRNNITTKANYTTGIGFQNGEAIINGNNINATGSNEGTSLDSYPMVPIQTTGICLVNSAATIEDNNITSTGDYAIDEVKSTATLKDNILNGSQGIKGYVTPETIDEFFDEYGVLKDIPQTALTFDGTFKDLILTINKAIEIIGDVTLFNNTALNIIADNVKVTNIQFYAPKLINTNYVITTTGTNTTIENNNIYYNATTTEKSSAIYANSINNLKIINNIITYVGNNNESFNNAIRIEGDDDNEVPSTNILIQKNTFNIIIPSIQVIYTYGPTTAYSEGIAFYYCDDVEVSENSINLTYNTFSGSDDTIYAISFRGNPYNLYSDIICNNISVINNTINAKGHSHIYAIYISANLFEISNNKLNMSSEVVYANGINIDGPAENGLVSDNEILVSAPKVVYGIYSYQYMGQIDNITYINNNITANAYAACGMELVECDPTISNNIIIANGNYTYGIVTSIRDNGTIQGNEIKSLGNNEGTTYSGDPLLPLNSMGVDVKGDVEIKENMIETTGTGVNIVKDSNATITNNNITSTGDYAITAEKSELLLENNNLTATGDNLLNATNCIVSAETFTIPNMEKIDKEIAQYKDEVSNITEENKKLTTERDDANQALAAKNTEAANLQTQVGSLREQNNQLTSDLKTANNKANDANANLKKVKAASKVKKSKNFKITATLDKKVKGKYVYVIFNGKSYKAKTNSKGVAKITIKKSVLKKLGGKKVKYQVMSGQKLINKSVKIKK